MIKCLYLQNFKCFHTDTNVPLSQINILYGKNGRGKSSIVQSLLILGQSMMVQNTIDNLRLVGELVQLGSFDEILSMPSSDSGTEIRIGLKTEKENLELGFSKVPEKIQLAHVTTFNINGEDRIVEKGTDSGSEKSSKVSGIFSDVEILQELKDITYVSANRVGPQNSVTRNDSLRQDWMGTRGEFVINVLANKDKDFVGEVEANLTAILSGAALKVDETSLEQIELKLNSVDGSTYFRPINVGFGYSFVLPVIVGTLLAKEGSLLIVENPEAHLHPGAQSRLMKFLIEKAKSKNLQIIVESHSDHVVNGLRIAMKQNFCGISPEDASILFFAHDNTNPYPSITPIKCDSQGELSVYPDDFLDEWTRQLVELI